MIRVAYFVGNYHRFTGGQRSLWLLLRALDRTRVEPIVVTAGEGYATRMYRELGLRVEVLEAGGKAASFGGELLRAGLWRRALVGIRDVAPYTLRLRRLLGELEVDVVHANDVRGMLLAAPAARSLGLPVVWHIRGDVRNLGRIYRGACGLLATRIVLVANGVRPTLEPRFWPKCTTVYNGIDPAPGAPGRTRAELVGDSPGALVVAVGSVVPMKGIHHLIDAVALARDRGVTLTLAVIGDAPQPWYQDWLERRIAALALPHVHLAGWDHQAADWIRAADIVCLPTVDHEELEFDGERHVYTNTEGFSRTVLEAMLHEKPVVASAIVGIPEQVIDGETGLLVPPSEPAPLSEALSRLATDPALRSRLGTAAHRRVRERFTIAKMVAGIHAIYDSLRSEAHSRPPKVLTF